MELIAEKITIESTQAKATQAQAKRAGETPDATEAVKELSSLQLALIGGGSTAFSTY